MRSAAERAFDARRDPAGREVALDDAPDPCSVRLDELYAALDRTGEYWDATLVSLDPSLDRANERDDQ